MNEELKKEIQGTFLESLDKSQLNYEVPEGYFDALTDKVLSSPEVKRTGRSVSIRQWLSIAASLVILVSAFFFMKGNPGTEQLLEGADDQELLEYVLTDMDLQESDIYDLTLSEDINQFDNINTEDIDLYIQNQTDIVELEELIELL